MGLWHARKATKGSRGLGGRGGPEEYKTVRQRRRRGGRVGSEEYKCPRQMRRRIREPPTYTIQAHTIYRQTIITQAHTHTQQTHPYQTQQTTHTHHQTPLNNIPTLGTHSLPIPTNLHRPRPLPLPPPVLPHILHNPRPPDPDNLLQLPLRARRTPHAGLLENGPEHLGQRRLGDLPPSAEEGAARQRGEVRVAVAAAGGVDGLGGGCGWGLDCVVVSVRLPCLVRNG